MVGLCLVILTTIIASIYIRLKSECEGNAGSEAESKFESVSYCQMYNQIQRFFTMFRSKASHFVSKII